MRYFKKITHKQLAKLLMCLLLLLFFRIGHAQLNLVSNYSFEQFISCPTLGNLLEPPLFWYYANAKTGANYFNRCSSVMGIPHNIPLDSSYQETKSGDAYIGIFALNGPNSNRRNYYQTKLKDSLTAGSCYYAEYYVSLVNSAKLACNNLAVLFTNNAVYVDTLVHPYGVLPANPQVVNYGNPVITDTLNWVKVSGVFTAQGGEQYLTLGNFKYDSQTVYNQVLPTGYLGAAYYIDDISVFPLDSMPLKANAGLDTTIVLGDSVFIGSLTNGIPNITWYNAAGQVINIIAPGFYVNPPSSTWYVIEQTVCGYTSRDTVNVYVNLFPLKWLNFTCTKINNKAAGLSWKTANEENIHYFNIQRSSNGIDFVTVGKKAADNKVVNEYWLTDESAINAQYTTLYYRVVSVDNDGKSSYSATRLISFDTLSYSINIYPNPAQSIVNIVCNKMRQIEILDVLGRKAISKTTGNAEKSEIDISKLPKGLFFVKIITTDNKVKIQKLLIE